MIVKPQQQQQIMLLAWPSSAMQDDDLYAAHLAAMVLGDGTGSRLFWNIFQKGLAETAAASLSPFDNTGMMSPSSARRQTMRPACWSWCARS